MSVALIAAETCQGPCGQPRNPRETLLVGLGIRICWHCFEWHLKALEVLAGNAVPDDCQNCGRFRETLKSDAPSGEARMYLHAKDGVYVLLCKTCSDAYERAASQLYRNTAYGWNRKLK